MQMEPISDETKAKLKAIEARIDELQAQIDELNEEAYSLVPKHTFDECRAMGCEYTHGNRYDCHRYCVRRKNYKGCFYDYYKPKKKVFKPNVKYPTLGWKTAVTEGGHWILNVVKETDKTLTLDDKTQLLKSTMKQADDCVFLKSRTGVIYLCADDPDTIETQKALIKVLRREWCEAISGKIRI